MLIAKSHIHLSKKLLYRLELWGTVAIAMIMKGASIQIMMRTMGKSSDYYDDSDDNGDDGGADAADDGDDDAA